jgi:hypothetical protein
MRNAYIIMGARFGYQYEIPDGIAPEPADSAG